MTDRPSRHRLDARPPVRGRGRHHRIAWAAAALFVLPAAATATAPYYRIVEIAPAVAGQEVWAWDLNNQGAVAGHVGRLDNNPAFDARAFRWSAAGGYQPLFVGQAYAIDDAGTVAGAANGQWLRNQGFAVGSGSRYGFVNGQVLPTPAGADGSFESIALGLGASGQVVGLSTWGGGVGSAVASWNSATATPVFPGGGNPGVFDIAAPGGPGAVNAAGTVVGRAHGAVRQLATWSALAGVVNLGSFAGAHTEGLSINDSGQIAGIAGSQGFRWTPGAGYAPLAVAGSALNVAQAINAQGDVAGFHLPSLAGSAYHDARAVLWRADGSVLDVNAANIANRGHFVFTQVRDVNDSGQMLLWGHDASRPFSEQRAFLMALCTRCGQIAPFPNRAGTTLDVGSDWFDAFNEVNFVNEGTLALATTVNNRAGGVIDNRGRVRVDAGGWLSNAGRVEVAVGGTLEVHGRLVNLSTSSVGQGGDVVVPAGGALLSNGGWQQHAGRMRVQGGSVTNFGYWTVSGGEFELQGGSFTNESEWVLSGARLVKDDASVLSNQGLARFGLNGAGPATVLDWQGRVGNGRMPGTGGVSVAEAFWQMRNTLVTLRNGGFSNDSGVTALLEGTQFTLSGGSNFFVRGGELLLASGSLLRLEPDAGQIAVSPGALLNLRLGGQLEVASQLVNHGRIDVAGRMVDTKRVHNDGHFDVLLGGDVALAAGGEFVVQGGTVTIQALGRIHGDGSFEQRAGRTLVLGEMVLPRMHFRAGELAGVGLLRGEVVLGDGVQPDGSLRLMPGQSPGTLSVEGSLQVQRDVLIELEVASASVFDRIRVGEGAVLDGARVVLRVDAGFDAELDDRFDFIAAAGGLTASGLRLDGSALPSGWVPDWRDGRGSLSLLIDNPDVPELGEVAAGELVTLGAGQWRWTRDAQLDGRLEVAGRLTHRALTDVDEGTGQPLPATLSLAPDATLHIQPGGRFTNRSEVLSAGTLVNDGELHNRPGSLLRIEGPYTQSGQWRHEGHLVVLSSVTLQPGAVADLRGSVDNSGAWTSAGRVAVSGRFEHAGSIELGSGGRLHIAPSGMLEGTGWVRVATGATLQVDGRLALAAGGAGLLVQGGQLEGVGQVDGRTRVFGGRIDPGGADAVGTLEVAGQLDLAGATLRLQIGELASDRLDAGAAQVQVLEGGLTVDLLYAPGLVPQAGDRLTLLHAGAGSWIDLARVRVLPQVWTGIGYQLWTPDPALLTTGLTFSEGALSFEVTAVPEPGSWLLMGLGLLGLAAARRRP